MRIIEPEVKLIKQKDFNFELDKGSSVEDISKIQNELFQNVLDHIEYCNGICRDTDVKETIKDGNNLDALEHGTIYLTVPIGKPDPSNTEDYMNRMRIVNFYQNDPDSIVKGYKSDEKDVLYVYFITTSYRVVVENNRHSDLIFLFNNSEYHAQRFTYGIVTNKGVANKLLKNKSLNISISEPSIVNNELILNSHSFDSDSEVKNSWIDLGKESFKLYETIINKGISKDNAYKVLPDTVQVNVVLSGFKEDFENLFKTITFDDDIDYCDIVHMIMYDHDNTEITEELANEMAEENKKESAEVEETSRVDGDIDISE